MNNIIKYLVLFFIEIIGISSYGQIQLGTDLTSDSQSDEFGYSVSISANGTFLAIGDIEYTDQISNAGQVRVYEWNHESWNQLGSGINGNEPNDWFGNSVALSDDGLRLVASAYNSKFVRAFEYNGSNWTQLGKDIPAGFGSIETEDVAISADGNIVAVGAAEYPQAVIHRGVVRVYSSQNSDWKQIGSDIVGENEKDQSGWSVSLSSDGSTVAIGSINNNSGGDHAGQARIFKLIDGVWKQQGEEINGKGDWYTFGWTLSLSTTGNRIAIGGSRGFHEGDNTGYVGIYEFNSGNWELVGQEIIGYENEELGWEVSLSGDGERVAISSPENADCPVRIFDLINQKWEQVGKSIKTNRELANTGYALGLSRDGNRIATASKLYGGFVQVYDISSVSTADAIGADCGKNYVDSSEVSIFKLFPNPTTGLIKVIGVDLKKLDDEENLMLFDLLGRRLEGFEIMENTIDLSFIPVGIYFLKIADRIEKIIKISL